MKQKAQILIAELDLHKASSSSPVAPEAVTTYSFKSTVQSLSYVSPPSPFCPKPIGEKICNKKKSKSFYIVTQCFHSYLNYTGIISYNYILYTQAYYIWIIIYFTLITGDIPTAKEEHREDPMQNENEAVSTLDDDIIPEPFDIEEHLSVVKANRQKRSTGNQERYVLFVIDASGSIGSTRYRDAVNVLGDLSPLFCGAKLAVMTYSNYVYREICFNCKQDNPLKIRDTIRSLTYHRGLTASGDAVKCACDYMFNSPCGFPRNSRNNSPLVDVLFLTDGHSNRGEDVCEATKCLNSINNINVFPIAIGKNNDYNELHCIRGSSGGNELLMTLTDFNALKTLRDDILSQVSSSPPCL